MSEPQTCSPCPDADVCLVEETTPSNEEDVVSVKRRKVVQTIWAMKGTWALSLMINKLIEDLKVIDPGFERLQNHKRTTMATWGLEDIVQFRSDDPCRTATKISRLANVFGDSNRGMLQVTQLYKEALYK